MADYTQGTYFATKDALASGDPAKKTLGSEIDAELALIKTSLTTKIDDINTLTEDTSPDNAVDYIVTYDTSASSQKKVLANKMGPGINTLVNLRGNATQVLSAGTTTRITMLGTESIDLGGIGASSKITLTSAAQDGYYICFGRLVFDNTTGLKRVGVGLYDSSNVLQSNVYEQIDCTTNEQQVVGVTAIFNLTFASGNYIALFAYSEPGETLASSSLNSLIAYRVA